jgi:alpha-glucosidase
MKPILRGCLNACDARGLTLDCGRGAAMRIVALADDLVRVTALRGGEVRQKRTWAVPAYGQVDTDWAGRARLDDSSWPAVAIEITTSPTQVALATRALQLSVTLDGLRMDWALSDGTIFARDRATQPYFLGQKTHAFKHAMARAPGDRHYGLGDKTGPLDLTGRRLRCAMRDSLGFDPERGDPLYKNWPFLIVRDAASGVSHGVFYDNGAEGSFDLGCEHDNYFGRYRVYEAEDGDLDFYLILGPRLADVTAKFVALTGRTALPPRWSLGFAQTAMALADAPTLSRRSRG